MFGRRIGMILSLLVVIMLIVSAIFLYRTWREKLEVDVPRFNPDVAQEVYQEKMVQTKMVMAQLGE